MTVLNTESRLGMTTAAMPRVNLLPPEIAEQAMVRKVQMGLGAGVLAVAGVVGLLFVSASHSVTSAQASVDAAKQQQMQLNGQLAKYNDVTAVYNAAAAAQAQLTTAMGQEVRYSQVLHDLSLSVPSSVWLKSVAFTQAPPATSTTLPAAVPAGGATAAPTTIGTVSFSGVGFSHDDLALWLESLAGQKTYSDPYFSNSTEALLGSRKIVNFTSTANLTSAALSNRYTKPVGG